MTQAPLSGFLFPAINLHGNQSQIQAVGHRPHAFFKIVGMPVSKVHGIEQNIYRETLNGLGKPSRAIMAGEPDESGHAQGFGLDQAGVSPLATKHLSGVHFVIPQAMHKD